jgi:hypothetical protein
LGPSSHTDDDKYVGLIIQTSLKGVTIPYGWGTAKLGGNLLYYTDFTATQVQEGKGGGAPPNYSYKATLIIGICLAYPSPVYGIRTIYKDSAYYVASSGGSKEVNGNEVTYSSKSPEQAAGITEIALGGIGQTPWSYLTSNHPSDALGYSGLCYAAMYHYPLNSSATSPNHNFEVQFAIRATILGVVQDDANPADIVNDLLPRVPQFPATGGVGDTTVYSTYCLATGLLISPVADEGRQASDLISEILACSNSDLVCSDGQLNFVPYGDTAITNNGVTYTPDLTPIYQLTYDDIVPQSEGEDPVQWDFKRGLDAYNYVSVGYLDRSMQYASDNVTAVDQANINTYGVRRGNPVSYDSICSAGVANTLAQLMVQRSANVRRTAEFYTSELYGLLDPMDLIEVPLRNGGTRFCRIIETNEQEDGGIEFQVEEMLVGAAHTVEYTRAAAATAIANWNADPGDTSPPVLVCPPLTLTGGDYETWIACSGGADWGGAYVYVSFDNVTYEQVGEIVGGARYGATTTALAAAADPDTSSTLGVNLTTSGGTLVSATDAEADANATLCLVGSELISFGTATAIAANQYDLTYLRRGRFGTPIAAAAAGAPFVRLDSSIFKYGYTRNQIGTTVYVKLAAFNLYGNAVQDLALVTYYEIELGPLTADGAVPGGLYLGSFPNQADAIAAGLANGDAYYDQGLSALITYNSGAPTQVAGNGELSTMDQVGTSQIEAYAVVNGVVVEYLPTSPVSLGSSNPGSAYPITSATYPSATGAPIKIDVQVTVLNTDGDHDQLIEHTLLRNGSPISEPFYTSARENTSSISGGAPYSSTANFFDAAAPSGSITYALQSQLIGGTGNHTYVSFARIDVQEQKNQA